MAIVGYREINVNKSETGQSTVNVSDGHTAMTSAAISLALAFTFYDTLSVLHRAFYIHLLLLLCSDPLSHGFSNNFNPGTLIKIS